MKILQLTRCTVTAAGMLAGFVDLAMQSYPASVFY